MFYANEALEQGISEEEEIKLSALMGCAYSKISLVRRAKEQFDHAESLDKNKEWSLFIEKYKELSNERRALTKQQREEKDDSINIALEKMHESLCCILNLYSHHNCLITRENEIKLSLKEAELLAFLLKNQEQPISSQKILISLARYCTRES
ncbi:hypothetical protein [Lysinibacillus sp. NPDC096212]|uniref:hypothetical protein n=1 Tax=unclassified Lysinibacillus TaxID=2636778 RepID=UPI0037F63239